MSAHFGSENATPAPVTWQLEAPKEQELSFFSVVPAIASIIGIVYLFWSLLNPNSGEQMEMPATNECILYEDGYSGERSFVEIGGEWAGKHAETLECLDEEGFASEKERIRLWSLYETGQACFHPEGGLIEYEGSEFSHRDPDFGTCLTDLEQMLREGLACRLDDDTIVAYEGSDYVDRDMSRKCLTKDDLADSEELVARLTAFAESQANKAWGDKASALVTEYCSSTDERRTLVTQEQRSAVFDAFDTEYSEGQVYTGLPRDFGRAVSEWCGSESVLHPIAVPPQEVPQEPAPMKTVPPLPGPGDG